MKLVTRYCAAYTRKSTEEGLDQSFNTLDAQREACLAYISSQKAEGWTPIQRHYDDGGYTGGNMERPALKELLADIKAGKVHTVVVYKIDRLTRSLMDFAKLVEIFDQHGVTFVSVTQAFSTTTSMGRLTLNVLLSFAQFEREVIGERVRDKIAASKKKGMWMGGNNPFGYHRVDKQLVPYEAEIKTVRMIFEEYLKLKCVRLLHQKLKRLDVRLKTWVSSRGVAHGGRQISLNGVRQILKNPVYIGKIKHKEKIYDGLHMPIIEQELWNNVQAQLQENTVRHRDGQDLRGTNLLTKLIRDSNGNLYSPSFTLKGQDQRRYRYYINRAEQDTKDTPGNILLRLPAQETEDLVEQTIRAQLSNIHMCADFLGTDLIDNQVQLQKIVQLHASVRMQDICRSSITKIIVKPEKLSIFVSAISLAELMCKKLELKLQAVTSEERQLIATIQPAKGKRGALVIEAPTVPNDIMDLPPAELKKLVQGFIWMEEHFSGKTLEEIGRREGCTGAHVGKIIMQRLDDFYAPTWKA